MLVGVVTDNLHRVLVGSYCTVSTQSVEFSFEHTFTAQCDFCFLRKRSESNIIYDTDSKVILRHRQRQVLEYGKNLRRSSIFRTQTVTTTHDNRSIFCTIEAVFNIQIQRFAVSSRFFGTVKNSNSLDSFGNSSQEVFCRERTVQVYGNHTHFFTFAHQVINSFASSFCYRTHSDDYAFCILSTIVIEQTVFTACDFRDFVHIFFYDSGNSFIEVVARFSVLEEVVRIFSHTASNRLVGIQCACTEFSQSMLIYQAGQVFIFQHFNLLNFMRGTETIKEVHERNT